MRPKTKEELAYDSLKELILEGELPKNQFLSQRVLAEKVGTNITTIRTALRQLESDSLIENVPQWGVRIPEETEEVLIDRYFIRELLEVGAVRRIVKRRDSLDFDSIMEKAKYCDALARRLPEDVIKFSQAHFDFHTELARQSGSKLLLQSLNKIHFRSWLLWHDRRLWTRGSQVNHQKLVEILFNSSERAAVSAMRRHINGGLKIELAVIRQGLDTPS
jgi:DNA-binding GntR family transcriptional regulator